MSDDSCRFECRHNGGDKTAALVARVLLTSVYDVAPFSFTCVGAFFMGIYKEGKNVTINNLIETRGFDLFVLEMI